MQLWDIKGNALRLMFADSDMQFSKGEFEDGTIYENGNTRDKLIRMNDSIRRAIDLYYQFCGQYGRRKKVKFRKDETGVSNVLDLKEILDFGYPSRIDLLKNSQIGISGKHNLEYYFDNINNMIVVDFDETYGIDLSKLDFMLYYITKRVNLPDNVSLSDLKTDLDTYGIPNEVQRMIPLYIKGELYEEDEAGLAQAAKQEYIQFLINFKDKFSNVQTRVHSNFIRR